MTPYQVEFAGWLHSLPFQLVAHWTFGEKWGTTGPTKDSVGFHVKKWVTQHELQPAFIVAECGQSQGRRWHAHGLLGGHGGLGVEPYRKSLWEDWFRRYGRCRFEPLHRKGGIEEYVSKYVTKEITDWWITNNGTFDR